MSKSFKRLSNTTTSADMTPIRWPPGNLLITEKYDR